ncbi:tetraacyldisaccharide 4'-kinase [Bartonella sp. HY329]|uniref:tetraacyldisaccharide 4'-kinase n=1 Tax=unclassified Bartonella TaxID=2645622 RepID=UPI0021C57573|nr:MULTISPECIES: tetraacyldisaccharide 4'-kinase [unclassified Bartonella]UXM95058.1 tetraacyldisaccharide 4'-kinase [Bartonella sp. HY329]UXN09381.1 tetraacyldisaccharide 4'-kinase [Bartonella sp. HY328]
MQAPKFWWQNNSLSSFLLSPFAWVYGYFAARKMQNHSAPKVDVPVLCIGNFTLGGAGKTPVAISLAKTAKTMGLKPGIVTRGHGGSVQNVHIVDIDKDHATKVGDEPLLLARHALVAVCQDRFLAAQILVEQGCDIILMDDGFQSRKLLPNISLLVVDALRGIGNGAVFPSGPLRAPLATQLAFTDKILIIGNRAAQFDKTVFLPIDDGQITHAKLQPTSSVDLKDKKLLAFAGIGNPDKFFESVNELGGIIVEKRIFADHHFFNASEVKNIAVEAKTKDLMLVTTAKDYVRLKDQDFSVNLENLIIVDVEVVFNQTDYGQNLLVETIKSFKIH